MTPRPKTIGREQTLAKAKATMTELGVRHLPVLHGGRIEGILSSRDIALLERLPRVDSEVMTVEEAMSGEPYVVAPDAKLRDVARTMAEHKYGAVVVMDGPEVVGIFTTIDALRLLAG
ncbi:MAG: CBS domain-containing protein [Sandaracinus sp.]|nr:CBS domain-containing protein [Sandaracinus sp.]